MIIPIRTEEDNREFSDHLEYKNKEWVIVSSINSVNRCCKMNQCNYCNENFTSKTELERHIINLLLCGESNDFCLLMVKQVHLTKWINQV